jgi:hypothetical protein
MMPIRPFLGGQAFDPEAIEAMSAAFTDACAALGLANRDDPITQHVAKHIVDLARRGIRSKTAMYLSVIQEFKANPQ